MGFADYQKRVLEEKNKQSVSSVKVNSSSNSEKLETGFAAYQKRVQEQKKAEEEARQAELKKQQEEAAEKAKHQVTLPDGKTATTTTQTKNINKNGKKTYKTDVTISQAINAKEPYSRTTVVYHNTSGNSKHKTDSKITNNGDLADNNITVTKTKNNNSVSGENGFTTAKVSSDGNDADKNVKITKTTNAKKADNKTAQVNPLEKIDRENNAYSMIDQQYGKGASDIYKKYFELEKKQGGYLTQAQKQDVQNELKSTSGYLDVVAKGGTVPTYDNLKSYYQAVIASQMSDEEVKQAASKDTTVWSYHNGDNSFDDNDNGRRQAAWSEKNYRIYVQLDQVLQNKLQALGRSEKKATDKKALRKDLKEYGYSDEDIEDLLDWATGNYTSGKHMAQLTKNNPVTASVMSVATNTAAGLQSAPAVVGEAIVSAIDKDYDPESTKVRLSREKGFEMLNLTNEIRSKVSAEIDNNTDKILGMNLASFGYNTLMSMADSAASIALGKGLGMPNLSLALMGTTSGTNAAKNVLDNGGSIDSALLTGIAAGAAEAIFEKIPLENLNLFKPASGKAVKSFVATAFNQVFEEGFEELGTEIVNAMTEYLFNGRNSEFCRNVNAYMEEGYDRETATSKAWQQFGIQLVQSFAGGALSGYGFGTAGAVFGGVVSHYRTSQNNLQNGYRTLENNKLGDLQSVAKQYGINRQVETNDKINNAIGKVNSGEKTNWGERRTYKKTAKQAGKLQADILNKISDEAKQKYTDAIKNRVAELSDDGKAPKNIGEIIAKAANGDELSAVERAKLKSSAAAKTTLYELESAMQKGDTTITEGMSYNEKMHAFVNMIDGSETADWINNVESKIGEYKGKYNEYMRNLLASAMTKSHDVDTEAKSGSAVETDGDSAPVVNKYAETLYKKTVEKHSGNISSEEAALIAEYGSQMGESGGKVLADNYKAGSDTTGYISAMQKAYEAGRYRYAYDVSKIDTQGFDTPDNATSALEAAYEAGRSDRMALVEKQQKYIENNKGTVRVRNGKLHISDEVYNSLNEKGKRELSMTETLSAAYGVDFFVLTDEEIMDMYGKEKVKAVYDKARDAIYIPISTLNNAEYTSMYTISHELTHYLQDNSPALSEELRNLVIDQINLGGVTTIEEMVADKIASYEALGVKLDEDGAIDEIVAEVCANNLNNNGWVGKLAAEHYNLFEKMFEALREFILKISDAISSLYSDGNKRVEEYDVFIASGGEFSRLQEIWNEAMQDATENHMRTESKVNRDESTQSGEVVSDGGDQKFSVSNKNSIDRVFHLLYNKKGIRHTKQEHQRVQKAIMDRYSKSFSLGIEIPELTYFDLSLENNIDIRQTFIVRIYSLDHFEIICKTIFGNMNSIKYRRAIDEYYRKLHSNTSGIEVLGGSNSDVAVGHSEHGRIETGDDSSVEGEKNSNGIRHTQNGSGSSLSGQIINTTKNENEAGVDDTSAFSNAQNDQQYSLDTDAFFPLPSSGGYGNGYSGYSMSNNAVQAYEDGERPMSKWTKAEFLKAVEAIDPNAVELIKDVNVKVLKENLLYNSSYHHTSSHYNKTEFYAVDSDIVESLTAETVKGWIEKFEAKSNIPNKKYKGDFYYLEWDRSKSKPKPIERKLKDVNIEERGKFYVVTDDEGNELVRKKIGSYRTLVMKSYRHLMKGYNEGDQQYSLDTDKVSEQEKRNLEAENKKLKKQNANLKEQMTVTVFDRKDPRSIENMAKDIKASGTKLTTAEITERLSEIYQMLGRNKGIANESIKSKARALAVDIVESSFIKQQGQEFEEIRDYFRNGTMTLAETDRADIEDWKAFRKRNMMRLGLRNEGGVPVDVKYKELSELYPYLYPDSITHPADQLMKMAQVYDMLAPAEVGTYDKFDYDEIVDHFTDRIIDDYDTLKSAAPTFADKVQMGYQKQRDYYTELLTRTREKATADRKETVKNLSERYNQKYVDYRNARRKTELKKSIRRLGEKMSKSLVKPTDRVYAPDELFGVIADLCLKLDLDTSQMDSMQNQKYARVKDEILRLKDAYDRFAESSVIEKDPLLGSYKKYTDENGKEIVVNETSERLSALVAQVSDKNINSLSVEELNEMYKLMKEISDTVTNENKLHRTALSEDIHEAAADCVLQMRKDELFGESNNFKRLMRNANTAVRSETLSPERFIEMLCGFNEDSPLMKLVEELNEGEKAKLAFAMMVDKTFEPLTTGENEERYYRACTEQIDTNLINSNGQRIKLTEMELMTIIMSWEREQALKTTKHLETMGVKVLDTKKRLAGKGKDAYSSGIRIEQIDEHMIERFRALLDEYDYKFMNTAHWFFDEASAEAVNDVTKVLKHRNVAVSKNYIPFMADPNFVDADVTGLRMNATLENAGFTKSLQKGASNPLIIVGLDALIQRHKNDVAKFYGLTIPIRNFNKVLNARVALPNASGPDITLKSYIDDEWGGNATEMINNMLADLQTSRLSDNTPFGKAIRTVRKGFTVSAIVSNISVLLNDAASYPAAWAEVGGKSLTKSMPVYVKMLNKDYRHRMWDLIDKYTPLLNERRKGMTTAELGEMATSVSAVSAFWDKAKYSGKSPTAVKGISKFLSKFTPDKWLIYSDVIRCTALWKACEYDIRAENKGLSGDEFYQQVAKRYNRVIEKTQPMYDVLHSPETSKTTNELKKSMFMFTTPSMQNAGVLYEHYGKLRRAIQTGEGKSLAKNKFVIAIASQVLSAVVFAIMKGVSDVIQHNDKKWREKEGEDKGEITWTKILMTYLSQSGQALSGAVVPYAIIGDGSQLYDIIVNGIKGKFYDMSTPELEYISDFCSACNDLFHGKDVGENTFTTVAKILELAGLPATQTKRVIVGMKDHITDIVNGEPFSFNSGSEQEYGEYDTLGEQDEDYEYIVDELERLKDSLGLENVPMPASAQKSFTVDGEKVELSREEYEQYSKTKANYTKELLLAVMKNSAYKNASDSVKNAAISNANKIANAKAKAEISEYTSDDLERYEGFEKAGVSNEELAIASAVTSVTANPQADKDGSGGLNSKEYKQALMDSGLTEYAAKLIIAYKKTSSKKKTSFFDKYN